MAYAFIYVTAATRDEAERIGRATVEEGIAACANLGPPIASIYRWQGKVEQAAEHALILKTRRELVGQVIARVKALHSYECPCVVALPIVDGNPAYLDWLGRETAPKSG